ncbi:RluA family pseudouridine synthase [Patescibacteria group bacterium]|nr:RluA family pseudouridine synthase [Patescibacteria group bacterium]MBU1028910.1 RluA family pseudouridine synthase [Patescibacteria group bacterium]MBU1916076.1 RluA family pseudouridine synthase [Patescibacteria group bacterium]
MKTQHEVTAESAGQRLDVFVTEVLSGISRSAVQKAIKNGLVTVNDRPVRPHAALKEGDLVAIDQIEATPTHAKRPEPRPDIKLDIIYEDDDLLVLNKPSGLLVHPTILNELETLAAALLAHLPEIAEVGDGPERPGIMQRLDKEASGLMVIAKTKKSYTNLKKQFQKHSVIKRYLILVHGRPPQDEGTIDLAIGRATNERRMAARHEPLSGDRAAITHYRVQQYLRDSTLISAQTETGRTHQIRAHFRALGCPVAGDKLYGHKQDRLSVGRLFLHAETLGFKHPTTGKNLEFNLPLPPELEKIVQILRLDEK